MRKKRLVPGLWNWPGRPRILIENPDLESGLAAAWALRRAGYTVAICRGPEPDEYCPLVGADDCALVIGADVVVAGVGPEIEEAVERRHPGTLVVAPDTPEALVAAVDAALGPAAPQPPQ
jgi:hypothetical protein